MAQCHAAHFVRLRGCNVFQSVKYWPGGKAKPCQVFLLFCFQENNKFEKKRTERQKRIWINIYPKIFISWNCGKEDDRCKYWPISSPKSGEIDCRWLGQYWPDGPHLITSPCQLVGICKWAELEGRDNELQDKSRWQDGSDTAVDE